MKIRNVLFVSPALTMLALSTAFAQTTAFTYQGRLNTGTNAANGSYDMAFAVYDANVNGNKIAGPITNSAVAVTNGLFTVMLDFGPGVFTGTNYWVEMTVSPAGAGTFAKLVPRQQLTPAPYALSLVSPQVNALCPPGSVMAYMGTTAPPGWLMCDGSVIPINQYPALYAVIGTSSGNGNGSSTTFNLPDMRGVFLRGVNGTRNDAFADPDTNTTMRTSIFTGGNSGNAVGSYQADIFAAHKHDNGSLTSGNINVLGSYELFGEASSGVAQSPVANWDLGNTASGWTGPAVGGGSETRPKNVYVNYIIKY